MFHLLSSKSMITSDTNLQKASFGMSWFWFPEAQFGCAPGILRTRVGFAGGTKENPTYRSLGDHTETVLLEFDADETNYSDLLDIFWANHDPTTICPRQYMSAIFYHSDQQKTLAEKSMEEAQQKKFRKKITTLILPAGVFYDAENYHQKFLLRKHQWLLNALHLNDDEELKRSPVAARINGYVGGYGNEAAFELERPRLNINQYVYDYVLAEIRSKKRWNIKCCLINCILLSSNLIF